MPIIFISKNKSFIQKIKKEGFNGNFCDLEDYKPRKFIKTYYILPGNSFGYMDTGLEFVYSQILFINIQKLVLFIINKYGKLNLENKRYLPIGSSIIIDYLNDTYLVYSPSMLTPQNVYKTKNAYYSCISSLFNILENQKEDIDDVDIIIPSICCGIGGMDVDTSISQIKSAISSYKYYVPTQIYNNIIIHEPNLDEQPLYIQNKIFKEVNISKIYAKQPF